ncbi:MAG: TonB-dependent receptor [bacterium]|nr:TonB-dependent receptor [bacterium]
MQRFYLTILFAAIALLAQSQNTYTIKGSVVDGGTNEAIPFATVMMKSSESDNTIGGTTTEDNGSFELESNTKALYIIVRFMGYKDSIIRDIDFQNGAADLGAILLESSVQDIGPVEVQAEKSTMEFKLDKRVYNIGKDISSTGMGALEVLNNVPSVTVDIEGNVSLRGNAGVQILINGKPSVMSDDPSNALGALTADMIESIEIITNPSAKYEAGGTSGIINIILKKEENKGFNGSVSANTGIPHNHSVGASINYRTEKFNFFTQFGGGYRSQPRFEESDNFNRITGTRITSNGEYFRNEQFYNITLGADYHINKYNVITLSGNFAYEIEEQPSESNITFFDSLGNIESQFRRSEITSALNPKWRYELNYNKEFRDNKEHTLQFSSLGRFFGKDLSADFDNEYFVGSSGATDQRTRTDFYQSDFTFKLDYNNPLTEQITLELGSQYDMNDVGNDFQVENFDSVWTINEDLTNNFIFVQKVLGVYSTAAYENDTWGVKLGARLENTDLDTRLETTNETNSQDYTNFFPTLHTSYKFSKRYSMQAGYSRRIYRPRLWDLNPFFNVRDNLNIRTGNPNLTPVFTDSYEITGIFIFDKFSLNSSVYHLFERDVFEQVSRFEDNVRITTRENLGTNAKTGLEINWKYRVAKWFTAMGDVNYGYFVRRGSFEGQSFDFEGDQWSTQLTMKFDLPADISLELTPQHRSRVLTVQGVNQGQTFIDAGIRKKIWKGKAVVNFAVRDVFASRVRIREVDQPDFYLYSFSQRGRFLTLGFSYSFGKGEAVSYSGGGHH